MKKVVVVLLLVVCGALAAQTWRLDRARTAHDNLQTAWDSLRADMVADSLRAQGVAAEFATQVEDLTQRLADSDSVGAHMADMFRRERIRAERLVRATAAATNQVEGAGAPDTVVVAGQCAVPLSWSGTLQDGVLDAGWQFFRVDPRLALDYRVNIPIELVQARDGAGRVLVTARSPVPLATITLDSLYVQTPVPVVHNRGYPKWVTYLAAGLGAYLGYRFRGERVSETVIYRDDDNH